MPIIKIALLGAESTGKSQLAGELAACLNASGQCATVVSEYLRQWCERQGRTPSAGEQAHIACTQQTRIDAAVAAGVFHHSHGTRATRPDHWVIADTTPLMTAVYSEFMFADTSLTQAALAHQRSFKYTLITHLDLPWLPDGIQRDGPHVRGPVDALLRQLLQGAGIAYEVISGTGLQRIANALQAVAHLGVPQVTPHGRDFKGG